MSIFDPPSDPFGIEKRCRECDAPLEYNPLIKSWECTQSHESDPPPTCPNCGGEVKLLDVTPEYEIDISETWVNGCDNCGWRE